jgi:hypothetical protein
MMDVEKITKASVISRAAGAVSLKVKKRFTNLLKDTIRHVHVAYATFAWQCLEGNFGTVCLLVKVILRNDPRPSTTAMMVTKLPAATTYSIVVAAGSSFARDGTAPFFSAHSCR